MIPRVSKFPLRQAFLEHRRRAKQAATAHLRALVYPHTPPRLAVIVPKKCSNLATTRNWLKRLTYKVLWPLLKDKNSDTIIIYKPSPLKKAKNIQLQITHELHEAITTH